MKDTFGTQDYLYSIDCPKGVKFEPDEYTICIKLNQDYYISNKNSIEWYFIHYITKKKELVNLENSNLELNPHPFKIDEKFQKIFYAIFNKTEEWESIIEKDGHLNRGFIKKICKEYSY